MLRSETLIFNTTTTRVSLSKCTSPPSPSSTNDMLYDISNALPKYESKAIHAETESSFKDVLRKFSALFWNFKSHSDANALVLRAQLLSFRNFANPVFWQVDVAEFCKLPQKLSKKRERTEDAQDLVAQRVKYGGKGQVKTVWVPASHAGD